MSAEVVRALQEIAEAVEKERVAVLTDGGAKYLSPGVVDYEWGYREALKWVRKLLEERLADMQRETAPRRRALSPARIDPLEPEER